MPLHPNEVQERNALARVSLAQAGVIPSEEFWRHPTSPPSWRIETGHDAAVGVHPDTGEYGLRVTHRGDPSGNTLISMLGTHEPEELPEALQREFRHHETLGHMRDMWLRASANGDPTGTSPQTQRVKRDYAADPRHIIVDHYGLHS